MQASRTALLIAAAAAVSIASGPATTAHGKARSWHAKARVAQSGDCSAADSRPVDTDLAAIRTATICLLNLERSRAGREPLQEHASLRGVASRYAVQMVQDGFFDHTSPGGSTMTIRIKRSNYLRGARSWALGENLAWGSGRLATPRQTVKAWMNSPGHKANILNPKFRDVGIGVTRPTSAAAVSRRVLDPVLSGVLQACHNRDHEGRRA
jgi:uncharacterized protein YkwD